MLASRRRQLVRLAVTTAWLAAIGLATAQEPDVTAPDPLDTQFFTTADSTIPPGPSWAEGEYLHWWISGNDLPPLVTTSPAGTPRGAAGVIGAPGTTVLFGGNEVGDDGRSGFRVNIGLWLDEFNETAAELTWFSLFDDGSGDFFAASTGSPTLARPFFDSMA